MARIAEADTSPSCLIVGAGLAGLTAARVLQARGVTVAVLDKGRVVGGRMATRRTPRGAIDGAAGAPATYDHGAQFFTVREPAFQAQVDDWCRRGLVRQWSGGFADASGRLQTDGHPRYCALRGMNSLARDLAAGLTVATETTVTAVAVCGTGWRVMMQSGKSHDATSLVLTPPVEQSLALLDAGGTPLPGAARAALQRITYDPCLALLVELAAPSRVPEPGAVQPGGEPLRWIADNHQKGISPEAFTVTLHAGPDFTRDHWDTPHEVVAQQLLIAAEAWLGAPVTRWQLHRWRYSQPVEMHPDPCLFSPVPAPVAFAGDAFGTPRVEGAFLSGLAAAHALLHR